MSSIRVDAGHFGNLSTDYLSLRRSVDVLAATILVVVLSPVLLVTALLVLVLMGRPIFFRQVRIGHRGPFVLYKFRTMVRDAEAIGGGYNAEQLHLIPPLGVRLRASSLDELPQLFNILRGDMTFIGPRPAMPDQVARYTARQRQRLLVPQGITGLAQVRYRNNAPWSVRIETDIEYLHALGPVEDLKIIAATVRSVLTHADVRTDQTAHEVDDLG